ncbi:host attachment protein [Thiohalomonas denitrificans]|uniref:Protein required for attachment to host cells n=1 Tax=Thiohalomonas denitrificans TaxID=415747 RepID=A0A1G5Q229_9GAMM|nr:host attachment protein [Thiohalomonas denitrificans]SCZ55727.1 Protein required for attachment to host cells [Thiohalomonas denitrificans]
MNQAWILVANGSEARLFRHEGKALSLIEEFAHPDSRRKDQEITSDHSSHRETRSDGTAGKKAYGSFPEPTDPHDFEVDRFARELAHTLDAHRAKNAFSELVVVAPPRFHGRFNKHMTTDLTRCVTRNIEKDYTKVPERDLLGQLAPQLG